MFVNRLDWNSTPAVAFLQYPYDAEAKCHKGFAFAMLNHNSDVATCMSKKNRSWFYVEGKRSQGGFNAQGRCYVRIRSAHVEMARKNDVATELVFSPVEEGVGLRDFKLQVEDVVSSLGVTIGKSEAILDGKHKYVHIHTSDAESAAVVKMFCHQFKENDVTMSVRYARKPKAPKTASASVAATAAASSAQQQQQQRDAQTTVKFVLEPITENYGKFGISYAEATKPVKAPKATSTASNATASNAAVAAPSASSKVIETSAAASGVKIQKGRNAPSKKGQRLAGTA
jgi:hypothetical protein